MRKFWIILLSLGLIVALSMPAAAADFKATGSYYVQGVYASNPTLKDKDQPTANAGSLASFNQRLRVQMEFKVQEGLTLVTRFDALEAFWGGQNWMGSNLAAATQTASRSQSPSTATAGFAQENIEFERAYVDFTTDIGRFMVGYQNFTAWGTDIGDGYNTYPGIKYIYAAGPLTVVAAMERVKEGVTQTSTTTRLTNGTDNDDTAWDLGFIYKFTGGEVGLLYQFVDKKSTTLGTTPYKTKIHLLDPYVKATFGPVYVEAEAIYLTGDYIDYDVETTTNKDMDAKGLGFYVKANVDLKPAYAGAMFAWVKGDDYGSATSKEGGWLYALGAASAFTPCLIFGSYWYEGKVFTGDGWASSASVSSKSGYAWDNIWFWQVYGGFKPMPKLDIKASYSMMWADQKPRSTKGSPISASNPEYVDDEYGSEFDLIASYKIFDNLTYSLGFGYFWTGDYYKGTSASNKVDDNYVVMHSLSLTF